MEIQKEFNPRISASDFLQLVNSKDLRSKVLIVDSRTNSE